MEQFARLAQQYHRGLGFEADSAHVNECDENGTEAIAHATLTGRGPHRHRYKDAVQLRREEAGWLIELPAHFGRGKP